MAAVSIRDLDDDVRERLRIRAAEHGRSMEAEIREILTTAVSAPRGTGLAQALMSRFGALGGVDLDLPERSEPARGPDLSVGAAGPPGSRPGDRP